MSKASTTHVGLDVHKNKIATPLSAASPREGRATPRAPAARPHPAPPGTPTAYVANCRPGKPGRYATSASASAGPIVSVNHSRNGSTCSGSHHSASRSSMTWCSASSSPLR